MIELLCVTAIINLTEIAFNEDDIAALNRGRHVCKTDERYVDTPCLTQLIKVDPLNYYNICGKTPSLTTKKEFRDLIKENREKIK